MAALIAMPMAGPAPAPPSREPTALPRARTVVRGRNTSRAVYRNRPELRMVLDRRCDDEGSGASMATRSGMPFGDPDGGLVDWIRPMPAKWVRT